MNVLLDTNILARMAQPGHLHHRIAQDAVDALIAQGNSPCLVPQVLYELWAVATRPASVNGLGFTPAQAEAELVRLKASMPLLPDTGQVYSEWERLVITHQVSGKSAHDARLVAAMTVHGVTHILTFNTADFSRFQAVTALDPAAVAPPPTP